MPGIRSTRDIGNRVHREAARIYRESYSPPNLVVADRRVYGGFPTSYGGEPLSEVASQDWRLACCYHAWLNPNIGGKRQWVSNYRADINDLGRMQHWEVKPFLSAPLGVLQDTWYRCSYNYIAETWADENPPLRGQLGTLLPGGLWEPSLCQQIDVTEAAGYPAVAVPMTLPLLPGLVLYAVFSGPQLADLAELALLLYLWIRRTLQRRQRQLEELGRQAEEVLRGIGRWIAENWGALLIIVVIAGLLAFAIFGSIGTGNPLPAFAAAALIILLLNRIGRRPGDPGPIRPEGSLTTINFPGVSVTMYPQDLGTLLAGAEVIYSGSAATITRALRPPLT